MKREGGPSRPSEIASESVWRGRRRLIAAAGALVAGAGGAPSSPRAAAGAVPPPGTEAPAAAESPSSWDQITRHNNYYEFSPAKDAVWKLAEEFNPLPWTVTVEGEVDRPRTWALEELLGRFAQEDRVGESETDPDEAEDCEDLAALADLMQWSREEPSRHHVTS